VDELDFEDVVDSTAHAKRQKTPVKFSPEKYFPETTLP
jgi:hypothetical protein